MTLAKRFILGVWQDSEYPSFIISTYLKNYQYQLNTNCIWQVVFENLGKSLKTTTMESQYGKIKYTCDSFFRKESGIFQRDFRTFWLRKTLESVEKFLSVLIPITKYLPGSIEAFTHFLPQHLCKTKTLHLGKIKANWR